MPSAKHWMPVQYNHKLSNNWCMKKFLTLFMATWLTITMFAQPQTKLPILTTSSGTGETMSMPAHEKAKRLLQRDVTKRIARPLQTMASVNMPAQSHDIIFPMRKTASEPIVLNGEGFLVGPEYDAETGEWYIALEAEGYTFRLCWYGPADTYCGTYVFEDISWDWTWGWYQSSDVFYEIYPSDITMTISEKQIGNYLKQIILDAVITDSEDNTYHLHSEHNIFIPKTTIESVIEHTELTINDNSYLLDGNNDKMDIVLAVKSNTIDGYYTQADFNSAKTKIKYDGVKQKILQADMMVVGGYLADGSLGYEADLSFYNQDTILHKVAMVAPLPAAKDTIRVSCTNLSIDESWADNGIIMVTGSTDLYDVFAMYEGTMAEAGVYENVALTIADKITWIERSAISAKLTLTESANGWEANIEAYGSDYNWYSIDMKFIVPEPTDTVHVTFENSAIATYRPDQMNMIQLLHQGEAYEASVTVYGLGVGDEFGMDNVVLNYSGLYDWSTESSVEIADVKGVLLQKGDTTFIDACFIGFNAVQYDVELWYTVPTPIDTVEIKMPVEFINAMDYGYYTLAAYTPDSAWYISLTPLTDEVAGTFVNDGLFGKFGEEKYDFSGGDTYVYSSKDLQLYTVEKGTLVVELATDGTITAEAKVICTNSVYYHIKMTSEYNTHLDYDEPDMEVDRTYTTADNVQIEDQTKENGYIYLALTAADDSDMAAFFFFVEEIDPDIVIPVGVYPINSSEDYGTVLANPGVQGDGVWPSYYALLAEGGLAIPLWLLVGGTVEVTKDTAGNAHMEVDAVNSYGVSVHIVYDGTPTDVENVPTEDRIGNKKLMTNGQLMILRNSELYNATGARLK